MRSPLVARVLLFGSLVLLAPLLSCEKPDRWGPVAARCAEVVHAYRGDPSPVEIIGTPIQHSEGEVEITYRTMSAENIPVEGSASCTFDVGGGELQLVEAFVDGTELTDSEVEEIAASLGGSD